MHNSKEKTLVINALAIIVRLKKYTMELKEVSHFFLIFLLNLTWSLSFIYTWRISPLNQFINRNIFFTSMNGSVLYGRDLIVSE